MSFFINFNCFFLVAKTAIKRRSFLIQIISLFLKEPMKLISVIN